MTDPVQLDGAIAVTRFGLGARPGEIDAASRDPQGWLRAQIRREGADQPVAAPLPQRPLRPALPQHPTVADAPTAVDGMTVRPVTPTMAQMAATYANEPLVVNFTAGEQLPTMQAAFQPFIAWIQERKFDKGDKDARRAATAPIHQAMLEEMLARARLGTSTDAPFRERWALFWSNHFTMAAKGLPEITAVGPFEREAIRPHVFGRFEDMLVASTRHPGMLLYLDNARSIGPNSVFAQRRGKAGLNENLGREIMELHTVGADAGYTQADVTEFARALTGWSMGGQAGPVEQQGAFVYRATFHEPGARTVMGRQYADAGEGQARAILHDLAANPHTANHLARKIAAHFVADDPPPTLVARLQDAYRRSDGDLSHVAETLIASPEAWAPGERKFKTPYEFMISMYRTTGGAPKDPYKEIAAPLTALGMRPFAAPQPNGWSDAASDWAAPDAIVKRLSWAQAFANAYTPPGQPADWARAALGGRLSPKTAAAISRAESRPEAYALLLMSPEFQRR